MKNCAHVLLAILVLLVSIRSQAQLPDGSIAPDFTVTDISGNTHTLYDYLSAGTPVVLQFSATWSAPDWLYHQSNALSQLYDNHGPEATNEVMVIFIESDDNTTLDDLYGTGGNTIGDYVTGYNFPFVDNGRSLFDTYACIGVPTIFTICPDGLLTETGQLDYSNHLAFIQQAACGPMSDTNNPALIDVVGPTSDCSNSIDAELTLLNRGLAGLTAVEITTTGCSNCPIVTNWSGLLGSLEMEVVQIPNVQLTQDSPIQFQITSANDDTSDDTITADFEVVVDAVRELHIDVFTDCWPEESSWSIFDENSTVVASGTYQDPEANYNDVVTLANGCYTFVFSDVYGDGMIGTPFGCANDGSVLVTSVNPDQSVQSVLWDYDGSTAFFENAIKFTVCAGGCPGCTDAAACNYDALATGEDGSCVYGADDCGCTDSSALNYNSLAVWDDGSCEPAPVMYGVVTDITGAVHDLDARAASGQKILFHFLADWSPLGPELVPDINTIYTQYGCNSADVFVIGVNNQSGDAVTQDWASNNAYLAPVVSLDGGADPLFNMFSIIAWPTVILCDQFGTLDDGVYTGLNGATLNNFNLIAPDYSIDQNSCIEDVLGCMDPSACNFTAVATIPDGSCDYDCFQNCTNLGADFWNQIAPGVYPMETTVIEFGNPHNSELLFNTTLQFYDPNTQNTFDIDAVAINSVNMLPNGMGVELPALPVLAGNQICMLLEGAPTEEGLFIAEFNCTIYLTFFGNPIEINDVIYTHTIEVTPNVSGIYGCTYPLSPNFNSLANIDDGSCTFIPFNDCPSDLNGDGQINTADLTVILSVYGSTCE